MRINLKAKGRNQELILEYLEKNASDVLAEKINAGTKTLNDCWEFIYKQAQKKAKNSREIAIASDEVFGWAVHFFEEDEIKTPKKYVNTGETVKTKHGEKAVRAEANKPESKKQEPEPPKNKLGGQISLFDLVGGNA